MHLHLTPKQHTADSAESWLNMTLRESLCHQEKSSYLPPVKDAMGLKTPSVYSIPLECGQVYIGQSG
jgi:hypothetical protein